MLKTKASQRNYPNAMSAGSIVLVVVYVFYFPIGIDGCSSHRSTDDQHCAWCIGSCSMCIRGMYGKICNKTCNICKDGQRCHRLTGICTTDSYVNVTTTETYNCSSCKGHCEHCLPGWHGLKCTDECKKCSPGGCNKTTGICYECQDGRYGPDCSDECPEKNCYHDHKNLAVCDRNTGSCVDGCIDGWWGDYCRSQCSDGCLNRKCNYDDGACRDSCILGRYGEMCNQTCRGCLNQSCRKDGTCHDGCKINFAGKHCSQCAVSFYGVDCTNRCGLGCLEHNCSADGRCKCHPGYSGDGCTDADYITITGFISTIVGFVVAGLFVVSVCKKWPQIRNAVSRCSRNEVVDQDEATTSLVDTHDNDRATNSRIEENGGKSDPSLVWIIKTLYYKHISYSRKPTENGALEAAFKKILDEFKDTSEYQMGDQIDDMIQGIDLKDKIMVTLPNKEENDCEDITITKKWISLVCKEQNKTIYCMESWAQWKVNYFIRYPLDLCAEQHSLEIVFSNIISKPYLKVLVLDLLSECFRGITSPEGYPEFVYNLTSDVVLHIVRYEGITEALLHGTGLKSPSPQLCELVHNLCCKVHVRAAVFTASGLSALLRNSEGNDVIQIFENSLFDLEETFLKLVKYYMVKQLSKNVKVLGVKEHAENSSTVIELSGCQEIQDTIQNGRRYPKIALSQYHLQRFTLIIAKHDG